MSNLPLDKTISQWHTAGKITGFLSVLQMAIFGILMLWLSPFRAVNEYWCLLLGFSTTGVVAAVCMSRVVRLLQAQR